MKVKTSPMVAPCSDRRRCASAERASFRSKKPGALARAVGRREQEDRVTWRHIFFQAMPGLRRKVPTHTSVEPEPIVVAGHEIAVSNPNKVLFPKPKYTKLDLVRYYLTVAEGALRGAGGRPNVLVRYPNGITGEFFYQKRAPESRPPWIEVVTLRFPSGRTAEEVVPRDAAALVWLANLACLELHPHPVRAEDLDHPDELRVDLDPVPGLKWPQVRAVARVVQAALGDLGLTGWPKTSGSRGMHVLVRIERRWTFDEVRRAALALAREVERRAPTLATSKWWKEERHGVFVDYNQNAKDRTVASAYSVRPTPDARVSAPLSWDEVASADPADFTLATMPKRFAKLGDRHVGIAGAAALQEAAWRAPARATVQGPRSQAPVDRDRAGQAQAGRARGAQTLEGASPDSGEASRACRRAGRFDARPLVHLAADPGEPAARAAEAPAPSGAPRPRREDLGELVGTRDLELVVTTDGGPLVRSPAQEGRGVAEAVALQVVVFHLAHALDAQRLPGEILAGAPATLPAGHAATARVRLRPFPPRVLRQGLLPQRGQLFHELFAHRHRERRSHADVLQRAAVIVQAEQ